MMINMSPVLRAALLIGAVVYLLVICFLLRRKKLNVQYSIIWLASAVCLIIFAIFPHIVAIIGDILRVQTPANMVFLLLFMFVLLLLLSLSTIVTGFADRIKKLAQQNALLEERVRRLEAEAKQTTVDESKPKK